VARYAFRYARYVLAMLTAVGFKLTAADLAEIDRLTA